MQKNITMMLLALVFAVGTFLPAASAEAALITDTQVAEQKAVLNESVRGTLLEELKLVQMVFIQLLEQHVAQLQAQVEAQ